MYNLRVQAATGINDVEELVSTFIHNEDQNFSLFNYVSEQNNELERLEEHIATLQAEKAKYTQESGEDMNQHKQLLKDLDAKLARTDASATTYETKFQVATRTVRGVPAAAGSWLYDMLPLHWLTRAAAAAAAAATHRSTR